MLPCMGEAIRAQVEARTEEALRQRGLRDPRGQFREWLGSLKESDPAGYDEARAWYRERLLPRLAEPDADVVAGWIDYGRFLAERGGPGRLAAIDETGRARDYHAEAAAGDLVLFLPEDTKRRALILSLPLQPSAAQRATCDLLVLGKLRSPAGSGA